MPPVPRNVLAAYGLESAEFSPIPSLINMTYRFVPPDREPVILQRLHPAFDAAVNTDIFAVTAHLAARGLETPRLILTDDGERYVCASDGVWRAQTFLDGVTLHRLRSPEQAAAAGNFVARFHLALTDLSHEFAFQRVGVHDTPQHLQKLRDLLASPQATRDREAQALGSELLKHADGLTLTFNLPTRICHGDLKISNLLFKALKPPAVQCLIDLDTLGPQTIPFELGDALRSWCNTSGEDTPLVTLNEDIFQAAIAGYAAGSKGLLGYSEYASIVDGLAAVSLELASRFAADVVEDRYWGWDPSRYASRREHNLVRARGQLALSQGVSARRDALRSLVLKTFEESISE